MTDPVLPPFNNRFSRRHAIGAAALGAAAFAGLPGCGGGSDSSSSSGSTAGSTAAATGADPESFKGQTLNLFTWASYHEKEWLADLNQQEQEQLVATLHRLQSTLADSTS